MNRVCVFCGANVGIRPDYAEAAQALGRDLGQRGIGLVYGGTSIGLMGQVADASLAVGGEVIGVLPRTLQEREVAHRGLSRLEIVETLQERKARMYELADGFVVLPGGLGTLDELSEVLTLAQLGLHAKPVGLVNVRGYFDSLLDFLLNGVREQLLKQKHLELMRVDPSPLALLEQMLAGSNGSAKASLGQGATAGGAARNLPAADYAAGDGPDSSNG